jgi:hypothetical protein
MMKVEELREKLEVAIFHVEDNESMYFAIGMLDSLIAAAKEEERERIRNALDVTFIGGAEMNWRFDGRKWYIVPYSVLVPKETE